MSLRIKSSKGGERGGGEWAGWVVSGAFPPPRAEPGANTGTKSRPRVSPAPSKQAPSEGIPPNPGGERPKGPCASRVSTYKISDWGQKQRCWSTSGRLGSGKSEDQANPDRGDKPGEPRAERLERQPKICCKTSRGARPPPPLVRRKHESD